MTSPPASEPHLPARPGDYIGLFLIALATLMLEILLTRIFSVTLWYHLAFVAVSIAMFGMTLGAVIVYVGARWFTPGRAWLNLSVASALFSLTAAASVALHLRMALNPDALTSVLFELSRAYGLIAIPFVFSGIAVSIALTNFPRQVARLYAADLAGAALGCVLLMAVLDWVGGPASVLVVSAAGGLAALAFALGSGSARPASRRIVAAAIAVTVLGTTAALGFDGRALQIRYAKGMRWAQPIYEKWNSYSRVAVTLDRSEDPFGWGLSARYVTQKPVRQLHVNIDASAETVMTEYAGVPESVDHLKHDVINSGLYLLNGGSVYIIGAGGGRDVLSALVFGASRIVAVELNRAILQAVNGVFGDVTGHLDRDPRVEFVNDEARSYLARTSERFDFIQISLIDTWAATAAGAFVLSENTLYTVDAWEAFIGSLTDRGIASVSRWYYRPEPYEVYKVVGLAATALRKLGVQDTRQHLVVIARLHKEKGFEKYPGVGTLLVKRTPFTDTDLATLQEMAQRLDFDIVLSPTSSATSGFAAVANADTLPRYVALSPLDLSAPDDNRPFFFRIQPSLLEGLLNFVVMIALALLVVPILIKADIRAIGREWTLSLAFLGIGLGFMLVEIAQMMRLTLLLGHPTFSLSVVLFGMLLSSGAGSATTARLDVARMLAPARVRLLALLATLVVLGLITPSVVSVMHTASTPVRVATALALLVPAGFLMGMAFPMAMMLASAREPGLTPWMWGINGAASVCASVMAVVIASTSGIAATWWAGVGCYVIAALLIMRAAARRG